MKEDISWIIEVSKDKYENLTFAELNTNSIWSELPLLVKLIYLDKNIKKYSKEEQPKIEKFINECQKEVDFNEPHKIANRIIQIINYTIDKFPYHESEGRSAIVLKYKERTLIDFYSGKNQVVIKMVDDYLTKKLDIIKSQKDYLVFDERKDESESKETYELLIKSYSIKNQKFSELLNSNDYKLDDQISVLFIDLYFEIPDLTKSNIESFVPYSISFIKKRFNDIVVTKGLNSKSLIDFKYLLSLKEKELKERIDQELKVKSTLDPKRYYVNNRLHMRYHYFENILLNLTTFNNFIQKKYIESNKRKVFPEKFEDIIIDKVRFQNIVKELNTRMFIKENNQKYYWNYRSPELVSLLEKLFSLTLLKPPLKGNYSNYGRLICKYFNYKFTESSWRPSKNSTKIDLYNFLKN